MELLADLCFIYLQLETSYLSLCVHESDHFNSFCVCVGNWKFMLWSWLDEAPNVENATTIIAFLNWTTNKAHFSKQSHIFRLFHLSKYIFDILFLPFPVAFFLIFDLFLLDLFASLLTTQIFNVCSEWKNHVKGQEKRTYQKMSYEMNR